MKNNSFQTIIKPILNLITHLLKYPLSLLKDRLLKAGLNKGIIDHVLKESFGSAALQIGSIGFTVLISLALTTQLGAEGYGTYTFIFAWVTVLSVIASLGIDELSIREITKFQIRKDSRKIKGLLTWSYQVVFGLAVALAALAVIVIQYYPIPGFKGYEDLFNIAVIALPFMALIRIGQGHLSGISKVVLAFFPETVARSFLLLVLIAIALIIGQTIHTSSAIIMNTCAIVIAFVISLYFVRKHFRAYFTGTPADILHNRWLKSSLYFLLISVVSILNSRVDILMLGMMTDKPSVGIYSIAARLTDFVPFGLLILNPVIAPQISKLFHSNEKDKLQPLLTNSAQLTFILAIPVFLLYAFAGEWILSIFGTEFPAGYSVLIILGVAHLFNTFSGSIGYTLMMTGNEREALLSQGICVILNIVLNIILIPIMNIQGAALASAINLVLRNLLMIYYVHKRTGLYPTAIGDFWKAKSK